MPEELDFVLSIYPDPVLRKVAEPVETFDEALEQTIAAMLRRMYASKGVGLAAPQVGLRKRILVLNAAGDPEQPDQELVLVNPSLVDKSGPVTVMEEGCLSFPAIFAEVKRPERCVVKAQDATGAALELEFDGFQSRIVQHEYDHLEGILLVDRMSPADKIRHKAALEELVREYRRGAASAAQG
jgi:peptide deformylase